MGLEAPYPGSFSFHFRFLVSLQLMGAFWLGADPFPLGPRHCGQFEVGDAASELSMIDKVISRMYFMGAVFFGINYSDAAAWRKVASFFQIVMKKGGLLAALVVGKL